MKSPILGALTVSVLLVATASPAFSATVCTLLTEVDTGKVLAQDGNCNRRNSPASTFKVALSLMGYDAGILKDATTPALPYKPEYDAWNPAWKVTTDPTSWLAKSVVWYSQVLTRQMGRDKFAHYVQAFDYGNADVSGNPGKGDGLTQAWLSSSLKISPAEQAAFLRKMLNHQLPVVAQAIELTEQIMPVSKLSNGWQVHGKTGTGYQLNADGTPNKARQFGWFIGWSDKGNHRVIFVHLIQDERLESVPGGFRARDDMLSSLPAMLNNLYPRS
ncbi:MAG: class D beta-lactamase [Dongiaceae bacterium]